VRKLALLLGLAAAVIASGAQAIPIANGDLVVVIQKGGTELYVNLGDASLAGDSVDLTAAIAGIPAFGGNLTGAKVVALAVDEPGRLTPDFGFGQLPQENLVFSSLSDPAALLTDLAIEGAMNIVDTAASSAAWFWQIRQVAGNTITTAMAFSYQASLGLGTDAVANNLPFSIAGVIAGDGTLEIDVYSAVRGYEDFGGPARTVDQLGTLVFAGGQLSYVPEPGTLFLVATGLLGLASLERRSRRA
jgi:hypothetical protein